MQPRIPKERARALSVKLLRCQRFQHISSQVKASLIPPERPFRAEIQKCGISHHHTLDTLPQTDPPVALEYEVLAA